MLTNGLLQKSEAEQASHHLHPPRIAPPSDVTVVWPRPSRSFGRGRNTNLQAQLRRKDGTTISQRAAQDRYNACSTRAVQQTDNSQPHTTLQRCRRRLWTHLSPQSFEPQHLLPICVGRAGSGIRSRRSGRVQDRRRDSCQERCA